MYLASVAEGCLDVRVCVCVSVRMCVCVCAHARLHTRLCVLAGSGCTSARRPLGSWWGQKVLTGKTMAKREIQLVQGLVPISQPLNVKGAERMGGRGRAFLLHFPLSFWGAFSPLLPPTPSTGL